MEFAEALSSARLGAGLTQAELAARSGIARPNIAAYEAGRREPRISTAETLLTAAGASWRIEPPVAWRWTPSRRPYAVPSRLWRLDARTALRRFDPGVHLWWSGPRRIFDLSDRVQRLRAYEVVLREGRPDDIVGVVDGLLLCESWGDLVLPRDLRAAWRHLVEEALGRPEVAA